MSKFIKVNRVIYLRDKTEPLVYETLVNTDHILFFHPKVTESKEDFSTVIWFNADDLRYEPMKVKENLHQILEQLNSGKTSM
jgi:hypothetical protein